MSKQICCEDTMDLVAVYDDPGKTQRAFNLHFCGLCGKIRKEDVWENAGILDVDVFNNISSAQRRAKEITMKVKDKEEKERDCIHCGWAMGEREGEPLCGHCGRVKG